MANTSEETAGKRKRTYWLEPSLISDLDTMETLTGCDKTRIVHEAVRRYKESAEFTALVVKRRLQLETASAAFIPSSSPAPEVPAKIKKIADRIARSSSQKKPHKKAVE